MPVTQHKQDLKSPAPVDFGSQKPFKKPLNSYAPGFDISPSKLRTDLDILEDRELNQSKGFYEDDANISQSNPKLRHAQTGRYRPYFAGFPADLGTDRIPKLTSTYLRPNAKFVGGQQSGNSRYDIKVEIKTVDLVSSIVTGFFQISGLTEEHPLITTCFKGEIINNPLHRSRWGSSPVSPKRYSFVTEETNWSSFPKNDLEHWKKLTGCPSHCSEATLREKLRQIQAGEQDSSYIYMRWKEEFLLPDSRIKSLAGASFEGFYYVVLNIGPGATRDDESRHGPAVPPGTMSGLYFYTQSEKFQSLSLQYVEDRGQTSTFDFA